MTINIPLSPEAEARLHACAAELGIDATDFILKTLEEKLAESHTPSPQERLKALDRFVANATAWTKQLPEGHVLDDSRESIYEGRGE